jgi:hypothetical protein
MHPIAVQMKQKQAKVGSIAILLVFPSLNLLLNSGA